MGFITPLGQPKATSLLWRAQRLGLTDPLHRSLVAPYLPGGRCTDAEKWGCSRWKMVFEFAFHQEKWWKMMEFDGIWQRKTWWFDGVWPKQLGVQWDSTIFNRGNIWFNDFCSFLFVNHYKRKTQWYSPAQIEISTQRCVKPITWRYEYAPYKIVIIEWEYCPTEMAGFFDERIVSFPEQNRGFNAVKTSTILEGNEHPQQFWWETRVQIRTVFDSQ